MAAQLVHTGCEFVSNAIHLGRGTISAITRVGLYWTKDRTFVPEVADFVTARLADGTTSPPDPLAVVGEVSIVALVGTGSGVDLSLLAAGDYQTWGLIVTTTERIIRRIDTVTVL